MDPFVVIDTNGAITDMNEHLAMITGVSRDDLLGTFIYDYFSKPEDAKKTLAELISKGVLVNSSLVIKDHKLTQVLLNGSVFLKNGTTEALGAVLVIRDITEQLRIEKELIRAKEVAELATEIADTAKITAEKLRNIAEDAVKAKQLFLSNMSHEIRTPMNAIIGFTKVMMKTNLTANQKVYLSAIKVSGDSLIVLINDILDLAKVDAGKMTFESVPFKLDNSTSAMLNLFEIKILEKNILLIKNYDPKIPKVLLGDPVRLHQIIINLLSNAIKFTHEGSITFEVKMIFENDVKVTIEFSIADTGIGVSEEKLVTIFEKFQQASSNTARLFGGTGLGLAIVKQLVEQQGGAVYITRQLGVGTTLSFTLDFLKTDANAEEERLIELSVSDQVKIKVLVVEDIELNQLLMKTLLEDFGFEQDVASNGRIAIEMMQMNTYDIILMDLQMPEMNGFETTDNIRNVMHSKIPIIALTADVTTVDVARCEAVGMNDYLAKPVNEDQLF
jgi:PAS domain S-box-containing protein